MERRLGEGGMGEVYLGRDESGPVAVKLMRAELVRSEEHRRRFRREADAASRAKSDHVVPIIGSGEWEGVPYLIQPYLTGGTLRDRLKQEKALELEPTVQLCREAAAGLGALHEMGLIHRDVKPENLIFDGGGACRVADFGLVKDPGASLLTVQGQTLGSPAYMAPEQIRGEAVVAATDVYSLACVVFECLVGRPPFGSSGGLRVLWAHLRDDVPDPGELRSDLPEQVGWVLEKGLAKEAAERPQTPATFSRMLSTAVAS